jgi:pimeloyl-ACP methyl ester carboxylesterase
VKIVVFRIAVIAAVTATPIAAGPIATSPAAAQPPSRQIAAVRHAAAPAATTVPASITPPAIRWQPCAARPQAQCGTVAVPLNWARPRGKQISVGLARFRAANPAQRIGSLFVDPGGPGAGGVEIAQYADLWVSPQVLARFDIVGMDPRGVRTSTPVMCRTQAFPVGYTLFPRTEAQFRHMVAVNRATGRNCLAETGPLLGHVDTVSVARDLDAVRAAMREPSISFFGFSYGTQIGANYAELFPRRVRALAIDSALEHSLGEARRLTDEARTVEDSFSRFAAWCRRSADCALHGQDVGRVYDAVVAAADRSPLPVPGAARPVTGEDIRTATQEYLLVVKATLFNHLDWAGLGAAIAAARDGDGSGFAMPPTDDPATSLFAALAIGCQDYPAEVRTFAGYQRLMRAVRAIAPHTQGATQTWTLLRCLGWPVPAQNPPRALHVRRTPPVLIVNATHDASTAYRWALSLSRQIRGSVVLTREGDGHTSYFTSACARAAIDRYLLEVRTPPRGQVCT